MERASPECLPSNAVSPQIVIPDAFCGIKSTQKSTPAGALPGPHWGAYTPLSHILLAGGEGSYICPCPRTQPSSALRASNFGPSVLAAPCLLIFDYLLASAAHLIQAIYFVQPVRDRPTSKSLRMARLSTNEMSHPAFDPLPQRITALFAGTHSPSH